MRTVFPGSFRPPGMIPTTTTPGLSVRRSRNSGVAEVTPPHESEAGFMRTVIQLAQVCGWRVAHFRPARTAHGWRTAVRGEGKGFPDLLLVRGEELLVAELKVGRNTM